MDKTDLVGCFSTVDFIVDSGCDLTFNAVCLMSVVDWRTLWWLLDLIKWSFHSTDKFQIVIIIWDWAMVHAYECYIIIQSIIFYFLMYLVLN